MMPSILTVGHASFDVRGAPWVQDILGGMKTAKCELCLRELCEFDLNVAVRVALDPKQGTFWPDMLACGAYPLFIISDDAVRAWQLSSLAQLLLGTIELIGEMPKGLRGQVQKRYFWVDGTQMRAALLDFDTAGFVDAESGKACGTRSYNISKTYERQHSGLAAYSFLEFTRTDLELFTSDLSPTLFFCKDAVVACAREHNLTNFRFVPLDWGVSYNGKGLDYMTGATNPRSPPKLFH